MDALKSGPLLPAGQGLHIVAGRIKPRYLQTLGRSALASFDRNIPLTHPSEYIVPNVSFRGRSAPTLLVANTLFDYGTAFPVNKARPVITILFSKRDVLIPPYFHAPNLALYLLCRLSIVSLTLIKISPVLYIAGGLFLYRG